MGSYASLLFKDKEVNSYKSFIPTELLLLFDETCLVERWNKLMMKIMKHLNSLRLSKNLVVDFIKN